MGLSAEARCPVVVCPVPSGADLFLGPAGVPWRPGLWGSVVPSPVQGVTFPTGSCALGSSTTPSEPGHPVPPAGPSGEQVRAGPPQPSWPQGSCTPGVLLGTVQGRGPYRPFL